MPARDVITLQAFAKYVLENACAKELRDARDRKKVVYNATDVPREFLEQFYILDLHCQEIRVWVRHNEDGPHIVEYTLRST